MMLTHHLWLPEYLTSEYCNELKIYFFLHSLSSVLYALSDLFGTFVLYYGLVISSCFYLIESYLNNRS
jgi:hypothetical protein